MTHITTERLKRIVELPIAAYPREIREMATELLQRREADRWIPTSKAKPEPGVKVLVRTLCERIETDSINKHDGLWEGDDDWAVTHWRPLPDFKEEK